jgi:uncharacterized protein
MKQQPASPTNCSSAGRGKVTIRVLIPGDEIALDRFLAARTETSMILRSNLWQAGLVDRGEPCQGTYVAAVDDAGEIHAVICQYWNGNWIYQVPTSPAEFARAAAPFLPGPIAGLLGPWSQTVVIREALGLASARARVEVEEELFGLSLEELILPPALASETVICRRSRDDDLELLSEWRVQFNRETLGDKDEPSVRKSCRTGIEQWHARQLLWVLEAEGNPVAMSGFNAALPDCVQIGGVWTPPALRSRGYARCVVAGSLRDAKMAGVNRAILFADCPFAKRAYQALGFRLIGDYGIIFFDVPQPSRCRIEDS